MDALSTCILIVVILCVIGTLIYLHTKRSTVNNPVKGGGIKMKGGDPTELLVNKISTGLINLVMNQTTTPEWHYVNELLIHIRHGVGMDGFAPNALGTALILSVYQLINRQPTQAQIDILCNTVISNCMKSPHIVDYTTIIISSDNPVFKFALENYPSDYLSRVLLLGRPTPMQEVYEADINDESKAILTILDHPSILPDFKAQIANNVRAIGIPQTAQQSYPCNYVILLIRIAYILNDLSYLVPVPDILQRLVGDPKELWLFVDKACDYIDFGSPGPTRPVRDLINMSISSINPRQTIIGLTLNDPGVIDFDHIVDSIADTNFANMVLQIQLAALYQTLTLNANKDPSGNITGFNNTDHIRDIAYSLIY